MNARDNPLEISPWRLHPEVVTPQRGTPHSMCIPRR